MSGHQSCLETGQHKLCCSKEITDRLEKKLLERNEDIILDYLEEIEQHQRIINQLVEKINNLSNISYLKNANTQTTEENS